MNTRIFLTLLVLCSVSNIYLYADENKSLNDRLNAIYQSYNTNPAESCRQVQNVLKTEETTNLELKDAKAAYYFLGNCQYQAGQLDAALKNYLKIAEFDPSDPQPLLDAGSIYVKQGLYKQAESSYREALSKVIGHDTEEARIQEMIENIPGKLEPVFNVSTGIGYDSNVNSGPKDTLHLIYGETNYTLSSDEKPRDDFYLYNYVGSALSKAIDGETVLLFNGSADNTNYFSEKHFNTSVFALSAGLRKLFDDKSVTFSPFVNYQTLDEESYQISSGMNVSGSIPISEKINVWPSLSVFSQSFFNDKLRDAVGTSVGSSASYAFNPKTYWIGSLFYSYSDAHNNQYTYNNLFLGNSVSRTLTNNLSAALGYNLQLFYYEDPDPVFASSRRDDGHTFYLNFDYALNRVIKKTKATLSLSVSYNQNNSNHSFQDNDRLFSSLKFTFTF
jgi:tetratricopeptide (TPR) repeat protein